MKKRQLSHTLERILYNSRKTVKIALISLSLLFSLSCNLNKGMPKNDEDNSISFSTIHVNNIELGNGQIGANPKGDQNSVYPSNDKSFTFTEFTSPMAVSQNNEVIFSLDYKDLKEDFYQRTANSAFSPIQFEYIPNTIFKVYSLTTFKSKIYAIINIETFFGNNIFSGVYELIPSQNIFSLVKKANENITFYQFLEYSNKPSGEITSLYISSSDNQDKLTSRVYRFSDFKDVGPKIKDSQGNVKYINGLRYILAEELGEVFYYMDGSLLEDSLVPFLTSSTINRSDPITINFKESNSMVTYVGAVGQAIVDNKISYVVAHEKE